MFKSQKTIKISTNDIQNRSKPRKKKENKKHNISHEISNRNKPTLPITTSTTTLANFQTSPSRPEISSHRSNRAPNIGNCLLPRTISKATHSPTEVYVSTCIQRDCASLKPNQQLRRSTIQSSSKQEASLHPFLSNFLSPCSSTRERAVVSRRPVGGSFSAITSPLLCPLLGCTTDAPSRHSFLRTCLEPAARLFRECIQFRRQLNSRFRPLRVSGKDYGSVRAASASATRVSNRVTGA